MTKATNTPAKTTDTPTLHGHYDGPRGHQDEHRHLGGDRPHGHADRQSLGRVVREVEYVAGDKLPEARAARQRVAGLDDVDVTQPIDQRPHGAPIVPARDLEARALATATDRAVKLARNAEHQRFAAAYTAETAIIGHLIELVVAVGDRHADHQLGDLEAIRQGRNLFESWAIHRGLDGDGDGERDR
jgi:hypothetical protein